MIKDCIYLSLIIMLIIGNIVLFKSLFAERKYFINTLSHDFRVIVLSQIKALKLLQNKNLSKLLETEIINDLDKSSKFSLELINSLLNTYKYKNNEQILAYENCSLNEIFKDIYNKVSYQIKAKDIEVSYDFNGLAKARADKNELTKAIEILFLTAICNAKNKSKIIVKINGNEKNINFSISYMGYCLSDEEIKRMFYKNTRFSAVGHGIKLHLCKNIIDFHNGKIDIYAAELGMTTFSVTIPVKNSKVYNMKVLQPCA